MGATASRSSPPTEPLLLKIREYSKLMRLPGRMQTVDAIFFRDLQWDVKVCPMRPVDEGYVAEADTLLVGVWSRSPESAVGTDISIEILDETGEHTVFQSESSRGTWQEGRGCLMLSVRRRELEASFCVYHDSLTVRFTLKEQPKRRRRRLLLPGNWLSKKQLPPVGVSEVAMAGSNTLTVDNLSKLKATLQLRECAHSTRFAVGGSRWYLRLYPNRAVVSLVRATKEDDEIRTTAEFSFGLEGAVNVESQKMTHTFDRVNPFCMFAYQPPEEQPSASLTDGLVVRCCVRVIPDAVVPATVTTPTESVLTPLLSAMHG